MPRRSSVSPVRVAVIGIGSMGGALARGLCGAPGSPFQVTVRGRNAERAAVFTALGARAAKSAVEAVKDANLIILAVKPYQIAAMVEEIRSALAPGAVLASIAAGVPQSRLRELAGASCPAVQVMPNTPASVGRGIFALCFGEEGAGTAPAGSPSLSEEQKDMVRRVFGALGECVELPEHSMTAFTALAGCGPAYVFHFLESLAEAGVSLGLSRADAARAALSVLAGSAEMARVSGLHPAVLREQVTSPGGMTIAAVNHMDRTALRGHIVDAVKAAFLRGKEMETSGK